MTLKVHQWLVNEIDKTANIHHLDISVQGGKASQLKDNIKSTLKSEYGDKILESADYILIFKGESLDTAEGIKDLFKVVDSALGKTANNLTVGDFKKIYVESDEERSLDFVFLQITVA